MTKNNSPQHFTSLCASPQGVADEIFTWSLFMPCGLYSPQIGQSLKVDITRQHLLPGDAHSPQNYLGSDVQVRRFRADTILTCEQKDVGEGTVPNTLVPLLSPHILSIE